MILNKSFFKSVKFFLFNNFKDKKYDVIFYYPNHFNRGENSQNTFFEPFYDICKRNNISYLVFEEPDLKSKYPRNEKTIPFDFILILTLVLRKILPLRFFNNFEERDWNISKILKFLFIRNLEFSNFITLSNSMLGFFRGLNKDANLYDYQHGVITSTHEGYIVDKKVANHIKLNNVNILVYGNGFKNALLKGTNESYYSNHVFVLGKEKDDNEIEDNKNINTNILFFSLQFSDYKKGLDEAVLKLIIDFLETNKKFFIENGISVIFKHHPRYEGQLDVDKYLVTEVSSFSNLPTEQLIDSCFFHITLHSTVVFESAKKFRPSILLKNISFSPDFYIDDYNYPINPLNHFEVKEVLLKYLEDIPSYKKIKKEMNSWFNNLYSKIDEKMFIELMEGK